LTFCRCRLTFFICIDLLLRFIEALENKINFILSDSIPYIVLYEGEEGNSELPNSEGNLGESSGGQGNLGGMPPEKEDRKKRKWEKEADMQESREDLFKKHNKMPDDPNTSYESIMKLEDLKKLILKNPAKALSILDKDSEFTPNSTEGKEFLKDQKAILDWDLKNKYADFQARKKIRKKFFTDMRTFVWEGGPLRPGFFDSNIPSGGPSSAYAPVASPDSSNDNIPVALPESSKPKPVKSTENTSNQSPINYVAELQATEMPSIFEADGGE